MVGSRECPAVLLEMEWGVGSRSLEWAGEYVYVQGSRIRSCNVEVVGREDCLAASHRSFNAQLDRRSGAWANTCERSNDPATPHFKSIERLPTNYM